jgi:hypothetical protein
MNCHEFEALLQREMDGAGIPMSAAADQHLSVCADCRAQHQAAGLLLGWARTHKTPPAPADLSQRIASRVLHDRVERRRRFRVHVRITIAMAASLLLVFLGANFWLPAQRDGTALTLGPIHDFELPALAEQAPMPLAQTMDQASRSLASLTGKLAEKTRTHAWHMLAAAVPGELAASSGSVPEPMDPATSLLQMGQNMTEGLQPLTRSAQRAVNKFFRDLSALDVSGANQ